MKELKPLYQDSPCTNTRSSSFKLGINPIKKEIETIWSEWLNCSKDEEKSNRTRQRIFEHIRKLFVFFLKINIREKNLFKKIISTLLFFVLNIFGGELQKNKYQKKSFTEKFDESDEKNCESSNTLFEWDVIFAYSCGQK